MVTAIISFLVNIIVKVIGATGYAGVFVLMSLESCGVPIPSEVIMPFSGFLVFTGRLAFWAVVIFGTLGNVFGSVTAYYIGKIGGRPLIEKYGRYIFISKHDLDRADHWFNKYGQTTVFAGRLLPVIRTYISFPAGVAKMDIKKFLLYTFLGALPWSILFAWFGVKLGAHWDLIRDKLHNFDLAIVLVILFVVAFYIWGHLKKRSSVIKK